MLNIDIIEDIELKKRILNTIQSLKSQATLAEQLIDASIDQIIAYDTNGKVISCNKTCADKLHKDKQSVVGMDIAEALPEFEENPELKKAMNAAFKGVKSLVPSHKDDHRFGYYEHHFIPLKNESDQVKAVLVVIHDVAHRIKAEDELKRLNKELRYKNDELKELNKEILAFAYIAGNDLKWPLRKIYSFVEIILRDEGASLTDRAKSYCRKVQSAAQKMSLLTDDIGALSIINPETFKKERIDLNSTLSFVKKLVQNQLINKNVTVNSEVLPTIEGSRIHMEKLFHCLINNAIRSCETNRPLTINITSTTVAGKDIDNPLANNQWYHLVCFSDNGNGFEITDSENIFNLYNYIMNPLPHGNIGVDLAMSKKICDMHSGFIVPESVIGKGSTFCCYFPVAPEEKL